jgi:hypothetical protein
MWVLRFCSCVTNNSFILGYITASVGNWLNRCSRKIVRGTLRCIETSGSDYPMGRRHIAEEGNPQGNIYCSPQREFSNHFLLVGDI